MMKRSILKLTVAAAALLCASAASATDYNSGVVTKSPGEVYTPVEFGSGWYLRGDISFNLGAKQETSSQFIASAGSTLDTDYDDVVGYRVGFGYIVNPSIRLELLGEQTFDSEFEGVDVINLSGLVLTADPVLGTVNTPTNNILGTETITSDYNTTNLMLNGYYDLPRFGRFTPYLGGGIGISRIEVNQTRTVSCIPNDIETCDDSRGEGLLVGSQGERVENVVVLQEEDVSYQFAYQLAIGTAYELSENLDLDVGYTYFSTNDGPEINYSDGTAIETDAFSVHKVNVGLRYEIF